MSLILYCFTLALHPSDPNCISEMRKWSPTDIFKIVKPTTWNSASLTLGVWSAGVTCIDEGRMLWLGNIDYSPCTYNRWFSTVIAGARQLTHFGGHEWYGGKQMTMILWAVHSQGVHRWCGALSIDNEKGKRGYWQCPGPESQRWVD